MATRDEFWTALQFMTRLPVPQDIAHSDEGFARSARFYPAVGLVVGGIAALVYFLSCWRLGDGLAAGLALLVAVGVTGALHEDGLADSADGLIGGRDRDHALAIMRDHQVGVYGALALVFAIGLQWSVLDSLSDWAAIWALVAGHALSRAAVAEVIGRYDYARSETAKFARPTLGSEDLTYARLWALGIAVSAGLLLGFGAVLLGLLGAALAASGLAQMFHRKLGGYTGDCLGATQQVAMLGFLIGVALWL